MCVKVSPLRAKLSAQAACRRICHPFALGDPPLEPRRHCLADLQAEATQNAAQFRESPPAPVCARSAWLRVCWASIDLQCAGRNQPMPHQFGISRASLRSALTDVILNALRTCRVSESSTASAACLTAAAGIRGLLSWRSADASVTTPRYAGLKGDRPPPIKDPCSAPLRSSTL
jgi:hypothetical protein